MNGERSRHRFVSSLVAFVVATTPLFWFYFGVIANLGVAWWVGVDLLSGAFVGLLYSQRTYSLSRLWHFVWVVWKGFLLAFVAAGIGFRLDFVAVQNLEPLGRILVGGFAFVVFVVVYGGSYQSVYIDSP